MPDNTLQRQQLRRHIRQLRRQLSPAAQQQAATALVTQTLNLAQVASSQHIALYLANDAELDTFPLIQALWQQGKQVYLPVLHPFSAGYLLFMQYQQDTLLYPNKFGIPEPLPACHRLRPVNQLDLIFTPLVAFDAAGNRLGMGGGFYDTTFAFKHKKPAGKPYLIGLAHSCQQVDALPTDSWDIPLFAIATETGVLAIDA